jgi:hypothetical protein
MVQSAQHKAKIAAGLRKYHKSCKGTAKSKARKAVRADNAPLARSKKVKRSSVFTRLVDKRSMRGRGPGRKGPAPRRTNAGTLDRRFKGPAPAVRRPKAAPRPVGNLITF